MHGWWVALASRVKSIKWWSLAAAISVMADEDRPKKASGNATENGRSLEQACRWLGRTSAGALVGLDQVEKLRQ